MREVGDRARRGFHPLDVALGLVGDRFSWNVLTMAVRLATKLSFAEARATLASLVARRALTRSGPRRRDQRGRPHPQRRFEVMRVVPDAARRS